MPEYSDSHHSFSLLVETSSLAQMPETCKNGPALKINSQNIKIEPLTTAVATESKLEKQENHINVENVASESCMEEVHTIAAAGIQLTEKETNIYTDKSISEFMLPELVCFQDSSYHVVKEISVDDGLPCPDKILTNDCSRIFQKGLGELLIAVEDDLGGLSRLVDNLDDDHDQVVTEDKLAATEYFVGMDKVCEVNSEQEKCLDGFDVQGLPEDASEHCGSLLKECVTGFEQKNGTEDVAAEVTASEILPAKLESEAENVLPADSIIPGANNEQHLSIQAPKPEENVTVSNETSTDKSFHENGNINENLTDHKESNEVATSDLVSPPEKSGVGKDTENTDTLQPPRPSFTMSSAEDDDPFDSLSGSKRSLFIQNGLDDDPFDSLSGSKRSLFIQNGLGELNSARNSVSGSIASSGQLPYPGNISFRSDSSTGSTRSFAFPVLAPEWNSSPVKMAKADRRLLKGRWSWKQKVVCCKF